jgi:hypothetical protein
MPYFDRLISAERYERTFPCPCHAHHSDEQVIFSWESKPLVPIFKKHRGTFRILEGSSKSRTRGHTEARRRPVSSFLSLVLFSVNSVGWSTQGNTRYQTKPALRRWQGFNGYKQAEFCRSPPRGGVLSKCLTIRHCVQPLMRRAHLHP